MIVEFVRFTVYFMCESISHKYSPSCALGRQKKAVDCLKIELQKICKPQYGCLELNLHFLQEQQLLKPTEPSFQTLKNNVY